MEGGGSKHEVRNLFSWLAMFTSVEMNYCESEYESVTLTLSTWRDSIPMHICTHKYECMCVFIYVCAIFMSLYI